MGVNSPDVALKVNVSGHSVGDERLPGCQRPESHPVPQVAGDAIGPHTKKLTSPVGSPPAAVPVTTARSRIGMGSVIVETSVSRSHQRGS